MNRLGLLAGFIALAAIGGGAAFYVSQRSQAPNRPVATDPGLAIDLSAALNPANLGGIIGVNESGKPCKLTSGWSRESSSMNFSFDLPAGPEPQGPVKTNAPFTINKVTIERDGKKVDIDFNLTVGPGETYELHVGPDDKLKAVDTTPKAKPAP
jgi:hypothetical protein